MKNETKGVPFEGFVGLRSKKYSYVKNDEITCQKAKRILKNIVRNVIKHENDKKILFKMQHFFRPFICPIEDNTFSSNINLGLLIFIKKYVSSSISTGPKLKILSNHVEEFTFHLINYKLSGLSIAEY